MNNTTMKTLTSSDKNYWETPQSLFNMLDEKYHFTLDAAASDDNHKCDYYFTEETDGLAQDWGGHTVFCNPPYGSKETGEWTRKCWEEAQKPGTTVVLLIPARTDRKSFHEYIYKKDGVTIDFLPGRLAFELNGEPILNSNGKPQPAPFPSMLVEFNMNPVCSQEQQR